ncbi:hypothetical protein GCM10028801_11620 [Nocardioides maradonensis]
MPTPVAVSTARRAVRAALAREASGVDAWRWREGVSPEEFLDAVTEHRLGPVLAGAADALHLPAEVTTALRAMRDRDRLAAMALVRATAAVDAQLAGLDHLFLKGPALAVQSAGDPTARGAGDIDVMVRPADLGRAVDLLLGHGWSARDGYTVNQASWAWQHQSRATYELGLVGPLGTLDLHWRLDPTIGGLPDFDELWGRHARVDVGPVRLATLARPDAFRHALRHAAKDRWSSLRSLVDISRLARDPASWPARLDRMERATLSVVDATVGLPSSAPRFGTTARAIPTALYTQVHTDDPIRFPGDKAQRFTRYLLASGRGPRNVLATASALALPPVLTADIEEADALPALRSALTRRVTHAWHNLRERA